MSHQAAIDHLKLVLQEEYGAADIRQRISVIREWRKRPKLYNADLIALFTDGIVRLWRERSKVRASMRVLEHLDELEADVFNEEIARAAWDLGRRVGDTFVPEEHLRPIMDNARRKR